MSNPSTSLHGHLSSLSTPDPSLSYKNTITSQKAPISSLTLLLDLIKSKTLSGSLISLSGPTSSSKSALVATLSSELGDRYPFIQVSASELSDFEEPDTRKKFLLSVLRSAIGVRLREVKEIYEGELLSLGPGADAKSIEIVLRSAMGTRKVILDAYSAANFTEQRIKAGDIVLIEIGAGSVIKLGRCDAYSTEYDLECERFVPLPKGDVYRRQVGVKDVTLSEIDSANAEIASEFEAPEKLHYKLGKKKASPNDSLVNEIDKTIRFYEARKNAQISPGIICVKDAHLLRGQVLGRLMGYLEYKKWAPSVFLLSSRPLESMDEGCRNKCIFVVTEENKAGEIKEISINKLRAEGVSSEDIESIGDGNIERWCKESGSVSFVVQVCKLALNGLDEDAINGLMSAKSLIRKLNSK